MIHTDLGSLSSCQSTVLGPRCTKLESSAPEIKQPQARSKRAQSSNGSTAGTGIRTTSEVPRNDTYGASDLLCLARPKSGWAPAMIRQPPARAILMTMMGLW